MIKITVYEIMQKPLAEPHGFGNFLVDAAGYRIKEVSIWTDLIY